MTKFAAIVPIFNNSRYLRRCIDSLIAQTRAFDEIILVNDGSTDVDVEAILETYRKIPIVTVINCPNNAGIVSAQNIGLNACTSDYIAFVDCDDFIDAQALMHIAGQVSLTGADYYFTDRRHVDEQDAEVDVYQVEERIRSHEPGLADYLLDHMVASHLKVIRKSALEKIGGFGEGTEGVQDLDVALKISEFGRLVHIPAVLYSHRLHRNQTTNALRSRNYQKMNQVRRSALERRGLAGTSKGLSSIEFAKSVAYKVGRLLNGTISRSEHPFAITQEDALVLMISEKSSVLYMLNEVEYIAKVEEPCLVFVWATTYADLGLLRKLKTSGRCLFVYLAFNNNTSLALGQWFNSYFDLIVPMSPESELALLSYCWHPKILMSYRDFNEPNSIRQGYGL